MPLDIPTQLADAAFSPGYGVMPLAGKGLLTAALCLDVGEDELLTLTEERVQAGRDSFLEHVVNCGNSKGQPYQVNWHHRQLAEALQKVQEGTIKRLLVLMPPRHGKSELVSRHFPAWCLGKNPDEEVVACSYSLSLAEKMSVAVQRVMASSAYQDEFETRLGSSLAVDHRSTIKPAERKSLFEVANGSGAYIAAGIGGPITGEGMTIGIVDDPIKNRKEANSQVVRDAVWDWWVSTFLTRGEGAASTGGEERIVVCLTPWHEDDLAGRILAHAKETGEEWVVIRFPAVFEEEKAENCGAYVSTPGYSDDPREVGDPLWSEKFGVEKLKKIEITNAREWNALYQCRPAPDTGNIFDRGWWQWYDDPSQLPKMTSYKFTLDAAFKDLDTNSFVVLQLWGKCGPDYYFKRQWRGQMDFPAMLDLCDREFAAHPEATTKLVEEKANGAALIAMLKRKYPGIIPIRPKDPKDVRAIVVQPIVRAGNVHLPRHDPEAHALVDEAAAFPYGKHDDQVDAMVQLLLEDTYDVVGFLQSMTA